MVKRRIRTRSTFGTVTACRAAGTRWLDECAPLFLQLQHVPECSYRVPTMAHTGDGHAVPAPRQQCNRPVMLRGPSGGQFAVTTSITPNRPSYKEVRVSGLLFPTND